MRKTRIALVSLCMAMVLLFSALATGCGGPAKKAAVEYKGQEINQAIFTYLCSQKKTDYLYEAYGIDRSDLSSSQLQDNPAIWQAQAADGTTVAETLKGEVLEEIKLLLYMTHHSQSQGYELGTAEKKQIKIEFDKVVEGFNDKKTFNRDMKQYGVNYDLLLDYNYLQAQGQWGQELLFGENGTERITEENLEKYYKNNYATAACIFINTKNKTFANGKVVGLPEEEKAEKLALADTVFEKVMAGENFADLAMKYSDQKVDEKSAKEGYTFAKGEFVDATAEEKVFEMKNGEIARVDTDGGVFILQRKALNSDYFETAKEAIRAELEKVKKTDMIADAEKYFKIDESFYSELDIIQIPHVI